MELIEAYYAVARDLQLKADTMKYTADLLGDMADRMCEARMREKQPSPEQHKAEGSK